MPQGVDSYLNRWPFWLLTIVLLVMALAGGAVVAAFDRIERRG